jgi:hypothetical protein
MPFRLESDSLQIFHDPDFETRLLPYRPVKFELGPQGNIWSKRLGYRETSRLQPGREEIEVGDSGLEAKLAILLIIAGILGSLGKTGNRRADDHGDHEQVFRPAWRTFHLVSRILLNCASLSAPSSRCENYYHVCTPRPRAETASKNVHGMQTLT